MTEVFFPLLTLSHYVEVLLSAVVSEAPNHFYRRACMRERQRSVVIPIFIAL